MVHAEDIERLHKMESRYQASDVIALVLYGYKNDRYHEFRRAFLAGVEDYEVDKWLEARGIGPYAMGYNLGAVWSEKG